MQSNRPTATHPNANEVSSESELQIEIPDQTIQSCLNYSFLISNRFQKYLWILNVWSIRDYY